jgi:choline dehydrogenase-like flavoprotein
MLHASEWFAVWPKRKADITGPRKTIGLRDFYTSDGARLGMLQSTGLTVGFGEIYTAFLTWLENSMLRRVSLMKPFLRISAKALAVFLGRATVFTMIIEDFPLADNRVLLSETDPVGIFIKYNIPEELRSRVLKARKLLKKAFRNLRVMPLYSDVRLNYGHPCGTCRFGHDPEKSVLDSSCRAHGLENLYIVDASFMPSSGGVNPSLTIAANALRVGDILSKRLRENNHSVGDPHYLRAS